MEIHAGEHLVTDGGFGRQVAAQVHLRGNDRRRLISHRQGDAVRSQRRVEGAVDVGAPALDEAAAAGHQPAVGVKEEGAGPGEHLVAVLFQHEEPVALNGDVEVPVGDLQEALVEGLGRAGHHDAEADLGRVAAADGIGRCGRAGHYLGEHILEDHLVALVTLGVDVGDVVTDDVHHDLMGTQSGNRRIHGANQGSLLLWR